MKQDDQDNSIPTFDEFGQEQAKKHPHLGLEDMLNLYIILYDLLLRHDPNEPLVVSMARTKEAIISCSTLPQRLKDDQQFQGYVTYLHFAARQWQDLPPELKKEMKAKGRVRREQIERAFSP